MFFTLKKAIFYLFIVFGIQLSFGQKNLVKQVSYFKDNNNAHNFTSVQNQNFQPLSKSPLGFKDATFWVAIQLDSVVNTSKSYLHFKDSFIESIQLYNSNGKIEFSSKKVDSPILSIPIKNSYYIAAITFSQHPYIDVTAYTEDYQQHQTNTSFLFKGAFFGLVIVFMIINLFFAYSFKDSIFLYYIFFLLCVNMGISLYDGSLTSLITNKNYISYLIGTNYFITPLSCALFCISYLQLHEYIPLAVKIAKVILVIILISVITFFITLDFKILAFGEMFSLSIYLSSWILGFVLIRKQPFAKYYVLGYAILFGTAIVYALSVNFGIHLFPVTIDHLKIGVLLEVIVLTYATTGRTKKLIEDNEKMASELQFYINSTLLNTNSLQESIIVDKIISYKQQHNLTDREADVLLELTKNTTNRVIAEKLFISVNTVKYHIRNIYEKLDIKNRAEVHKKIQNANL